MLGLNCRGKDSISIRKKGKKNPFQCNKEEKHCPEGMRNAHYWGCLRKDLAGIAAPDLEGGAIMDNL